MKSNMQYVILILIIFALQLGFYTNFRQYESHLNVDQTTLNYLKKQNEQYQVRISSLQSQESRTPASVSKVKVRRGGGEPIDMSEYYFSQALELYKKNKIDNALNILNKVVENTLVPENITKAIYLKFQYKCLNKMDDSCIKDIDYLITQHPESPWTGLTLKLLTQYYEKNHQFTEAKSLKNIIRKNFTKLNVKNEKIHL